MGHSEILGPPNHVFEHWKHEQAKTNRFDGPGNLIVFFTLYRSKMGSKMKNSGLLEGLVLCEIITEALPGVLWNRGTKEERSKNEGNRGTKAILGNREHRKSKILILGDKAIYFMGTREQVPPTPRRAS